MVVVQLGNSKVAASWTRIFFLDEHVVWICGFRISALSIFCTVFFFDWILACGLFWWTSKGSNGWTSKRTWRGLKMEWTSKMWNLFGVSIGPISDILLINSPVHDRLC